MVLDAFNYNHLIANLGHARYFLGKGAYQHPFHCIDLHGCRNPDLHALMIYVIVNVIY